MGKMADIDGNEYILNPDKTTYERDSAYWNSLAEQAARSRKRTAVVIVDDEVRFRAWFQREVTT